MLFPASATWYVSFFAGCCLFSHRSLLPFGPFRPVARSPARIVSVYSLWPFCFCVALPPLPLTCSRGFRVNSSPSQDKPSAPVYFKCAHTVCRDCAENVMLAGNEASPAKCPICKKLIEKFTPVSGSEPVDYAVNRGLAVFAVSERALASECPVVCFFVGWIHYAQCVFRVPPCVLLRRQHCFRQYFIVQYGIHGANAWKLVGFLE